MLAVVDTNVWVSAFLTPGGAAWKLLGNVRSGRLTLVYSEAVEAEYREVLARSKFNLNPALVADFLERLHAEGRRATSVPPLMLALPDPADAPFIALARHAGCAIVTGNIRHFPKRVGVEVLTPAQCLAKLAGAGDAA
ncbi:MAG: putative toxin-antitoxin system toxin component, PIN family [Betaproteobacteria bacterium]|nr:putative toxin-antitoxin system toxin component, PIN family [Betaproteobacteria bacterium]